MHGIHTGRASQVKSWVLNNHLSFLMFLLRTGIMFFGLGRKCSKLFHTLGFTELRRLIFIEQLFQEGNLHSFSSLKKNENPKSEISITSAIYTNKAITKKNSQC